MRKYDEQVVTFLAQPENVQFAFEIWKLFSETIVRLTVDFWKQLRDILQERLSAENLAGNWTIECPKNESEWRKDNGGITIRQSEVGKDDNSLSIRFRIQHHEVRDGGRLVFFGLMWNRQMPSREPMSALVNDLVNRLKGDGFGKDQWFPAWKYCSDAELNDERGLLSIAKGEKAQEVV